MSAGDIHPDLSNLAMLIGSWSGWGRGDYPTIDAFEYGEHVEIAHSGRPFLTYVQRTVRSGDHPESGSPLHAETGYFRPAGSGGVELVLAQPSGIVEVHEGTATDGTIHLRSSLAGGTATAKEVRTVERRIVVAADVMTYELRLGAVGREHQLHLTAELRRTS